MAKAALEPSDDAQDTGASSENEPPGDTEILLNDPGTSDQERKLRELEPVEQKALLLWSSLKERNRAEAAERDRQRFKDEGELLRMSAGRLTGVSLEHGASDARIVIRARLHEFLGALPMPPGLSASEITQYRVDALVMLLRLDPQNDLERMALSQMIACHYAAMQCFRDAASAPLEKRSQYLNLANKMLASFDRLASSHRKSRPSRPGSDEEVDLKHMAELLLLFFEKNDIDANEWSGDVPD